MLKYLLIKPVSHIETPNSMCMHEVFQIYPKESLSQYWLSSGSRTEAFTWTIRFSGFGMGLRFSRQNSVFWWVIKMCRYHLCNMQLHSPHLYYSMSFPPCFSFQIHVKKYLLLSVSGGTVNWVWKSGCCFSIMSFFLVTIFYILRSGMVYSLSLKPE